MSAAVVFDFGGVVFRWQPLDLIRRAIPEHAIDAPAAQRIATDVFQGFVPGSDWAAFDLGQVDAQELARRIGMRSGLPHTAVARIIAAVPDHLQPQAGMVALMQSLRDAGRRLFYLSNMPPAYADHLERTHEFFSWFDGGIFSGRVGIIKPQPEIFELARERFGVDPAASVFVDDNPCNVDAALALGWQAIRFVDAGQCANALSAGGWL